MQADASGRQAVLAQLLEQYHDFVDPQQPRGDGLTGGDNDDGVDAPLMPKTYSTDVKVLERMLAELRLERRDLWRALAVRYLHAERVAKVANRKGGRWFGLGRNESVVAVAGGWGWLLAMTDERGRKQTRPVELPVVVARWRGDVAPEAVLAGLAWLAERWPLRREPMLPKEALRPRDAAVA